MVPRGRIFTRLLSSSTKKFKKKNDNFKGFPKYFLPNQLDATPIISESMIVQAEEALFNSSDDTFEEMFKMHPTMLNIEGRTVLAKEQPSSSLYYYDIGHKDTFSSPSSLSNLPVQDTDTDVLQKMSLDIKNDENKENIEETIAKLQSFSEDKLTKVPLRIEKSSLELVKGRLVALPSKSQEKKASQVEKASLYMLYESLVSGVILPGRVISVGGQHLLVSVGNVIRSLPVSMVIPASLRVFLNIDQIKVEKVLKELLYEIVHVKARNKPSVEFPGVELETSFFEKAVADNRVCLTLGAWADANKYDLLPSVIKKLVSIKDYDGYQEKYLKSSTKNRPKPMK